MPYTTFITQLCIQFHDLKWKDYIFSGCSGLTIYVMGIDIGKFNLGCFQTNKTENLIQSENLLTRLENMSRRKLVSNEEVNGLLEQIFAEYLKRKN